jgi:hypothetical protein
MLPAEWGRARDVQTVATHSASMCPPHRHRHCLASPARSCSAQGSGLRAQGSGLWGTCTNSQLLLPLCCIQPTILPYTFLCFRARILQPRYLHSLLHLSQRLRHLHSATTIAVAIAIAIAIATVTAVLGLFPPCRSASSTSSTCAGITPLPRYVALHHVESPRSPAPAPAPAPAAITGHAHAKTGHN